MSHSNFCVVFICYNVQISKVRRMLTEVLLDVTSSEMKQLTKDAIEEAKSHTATIVHKQLLYYCVTCVHCVQF